MRPPTSSHYLLLTGLAAAGVQCVLFREALTAFSGNEITTGIMLGVWLLATGGGSLVGSRMQRWHGPGMASVMIGGAVLGLLAVRASRLLVAPGEITPPALIPVIALIIQAPFAIVAGMAFGHFAREAAPRGLYGAENAGGILGALVVVCGVALVSPDVWILVASVAPLTLLTWRHRIALPVAVALVVVALLSDHTSAQWKYRGTASQIRYGSQGEVALIARGGDTTVMLNNTPLRSSMSAASVEQAVHVPMSLHHAPGRVLVVNDRGHLGQLARYEGLTVDDLEMDPLLAGPRSRIGTPETFRPQEKYDVALVGCDMPDNVAAGRLLSVEFFGRVKRLLTTGGVFSFSLPLSPNYLSPAEKELLDVVRVTLSRVFAHVRVLPGEGYTFVASDRVIDGPIVPRVKTDFLVAQVLPSLDSTRVVEANEPVKSAAVNSRVRPLGLRLGLQRWAELAEVPLALYAAILMVVMAAGGVLLPRRLSMLSVGTSGFVVGVYSVTLMLLYQSSYGTLYSQVALLLMALIAGCAIGSRIPRFPAADAVIGLYASATLILLAQYPNPSMGIFVVLHAGMGILAGAQFVNSARNDAGALYAADLLGGVAGMALCSTLLVPVVGVVNTALGVAGLKVAVELVAAVARRNSNLPRRGVARQK